MENKSDKLSQTSIRFRPELLKRARIACVELDMSFQALVESALESKLAVGTPTNADEKPVQSGDTTLGKDPVPDLSHLSHNLKARLVKSSQELAELFAIGDQKSISSLESVLEALLHGAQSENKRALSEAPSRGTASAIPYGNHHATRVGGLPRAKRGH